MAKIQIVTDMARQSRVFDDFAAVEAAGYKRTGGAGAEYLHPVLRGQPCFEGLAGPMYGKVDGEDAIRYEDAGSCDLLSR